jgi:hypothetical protein
LFRNYTSEEELLDLKAALVDYLSKKVVKEADRAFDEKGYTTDTLEEWRKEHNCMARA